MHLVSCRHSTSGRAALRNLATRSIRSRTELMFQVVREKRMGRTYQGRAKNTRLSSHSKAARQNQAVASTSLAIAHKKDVDGWDEPGHDGKRTVEDRGQPGGTP